ncbi:hypothetical protein [Sphingobacterium sp.]|uniref:hypothetical protein n=1 Tax=Sphingobacterium sp. TaxID=341027 RepID=UPI00289D9536|nr:hypothetical protein [Sphingobacterium sp.]
MNRLFPILIHAILFSNCHNDSKHTLDRISVSEQLNVLDALGSHMQPRITDLTEAKRVPTNQFLLASYYPLTPAEVKAMEIASKQQGSFATDLADRIHCTLTHVELKNEKSEEVSLADTIQNPLYLQRFGLWDYDNTTCQNVGITIQTGQFFSKLKGTVQLKLQIDQETEKLIDIPIEISINDNLK